jgi:hypothetical protein
LERFCISRALKGRLGGDVEWHDITHFFRAYVEANHEDQDSDEWDKSPEPSASESEASFEDEQPTRKRRSRGQVSHPATAYMAPEPVHGSTTGMTSDVEWHNIAFLPSRLSAWHMRIGDWLRS